jgi:hypothetical protein
LPGPLRDCRPKKPSPEKLRIRFENAPNMLCRRRCRRQPGQSPRLNGSA